MTIPEARQETDHAWRVSYSPERNAEAINAISRRPVPLSPQPSGFASIFPRHLFSADEQARLAEACLSKPAADHEPDKRSHWYVALPPKEQARGKRGTGRCDERTEGRVI